MTEVGGLSAKSIVSAKVSQNGTSATYQEQSATHNDVTDVKMHRQIHTMSRQMRKKA